MADRGAAQTLPQTFPARLGAKATDATQGWHGGLGDPKREACAPGVWRKSSGAAAQTAPRPLPVTHESPGLSRCLKRTDLAPVSPEPRHHYCPRARPQLTGRGRLDAGAGCARGEAPAVLKLGLGQLGLLRPPGRRASSPPPSPEPASRVVMSGAADPGGGTGAGRRGPPSSCGPETLAKFKGAQVSRWRHRSPPLLCFPAFS